MTFFDLKTFFVQERHFERVFAYIRKKLNFDFYNLVRFQPKVPSGDLRSYFWKADSKTSFRRIIPDLRKL